jgi:cell division protein FtsN
MAGRAGLSFGQLITLTFGFLLASVVIFVFGIWVGRDLAEQRNNRERDVARVPVGAPPPPPPTAPPTVPRAVVPQAPVVSTPTPVPRVLSPTVLIVVRATTTRPAVATTPTAGSGMWTVQAYATDDTVRAVMLARTLRSKGYDASTASKQVGGATWYVVRVGRFRDRAAAKTMESKLRAEEGLEAASVTAQ